MQVTTPKIGFVSLGCPKATVDSERILTQLRAEGYGLAPTYDGADLVIVNTCGFIDAAVDESLATIGEAPCPSTGASSSPVAWVLGPNWCGRSTPRCWPRSGPTPTRR